MQCSTKTSAQQCTTAHNSAHLRCFENGNDDFGVEAFWIGDAARVGYFVPLNGPLNGHPPSVIVQEHYPTNHYEHGKKCRKLIFSGYISVLPLIEHLMNPQKSALRVCIICILIRWMKKLTIWNYGCTISMSRSMFIVLMMFSLSTHD